jgi:hypothetical protein
MGHIADKIIPDFRQALLTEHDKYSYSKTERMIVQVTVKKWQDISD